MPHGADDICNDVHASDTGGTRIVDTDKPSSTVTPRPWPRAPMHVHAQEIDPHAEASKAESIWRSLSESRLPSYFLSWPWVENWLATLPRHVHLRLLTIFEGGIPVAACFLGRRTVRRAHVILSRALFLNGTGHEDLDDIIIEHNGWLVRSPNEWPLSRILEHLPRGWDELFLDAMDGAHIAGAPPSRRRGKVLVRRSAPCPVVELEKVRGAAGGYLSLLGKETRSQIARSIRRYEARAPLVLEIATDLPQARGIFEELVTLHQATWGDRGKAGAFANLYLRTFHERLIGKRFAHGEIQLLRLRAGDHSIGCLYNFVWDGVVSFYQSGLAYEEDNKLKPGLVCHAEAVRHNAAAGHHTYDFLGGAARYKRSLSTAEGELVWATVQKPRPQFLVEERLRSLRDRWRTVRARFEKTTADPRP